MNHRYVLMVIGLALSACGPADVSTEKSPEYPETSTVDHIDTYHGTDVADPYRWLEDDVRESEAVKNWVDTQNEVTFAYLENIEERDIIGKRLTELWDFERFSAPVKEAGRYYYSSSFFQFNGVGAS